MSLSRGGFDILQGPDKAETGKSSGDPIMSKLNSTLLNGKEKYDGSKGKAIMILAEIARIGECLTGVSPTYGAAWNGRMKCTTGASLATQEHEAMVETARKLYEALSQGGEPPLTMMQSILTKIAAHGLLSDQGGGEVCRWSVHTPPVCGGQLDQDMLPRRSGA